MKTDDLVAALAVGVEPVPQGLVSRRLGQALLLALPVSVAIMVLDYGVRPDLREAMGWPMFWVKLLFPLAVAGAGLVAVYRLARPGVAAGAAALAAVVPVLLLWGLAALVWWGAAPEERAALLWGQTWQSCVFSIALMAGPLLLAVLWVLKGMAPTRPAWAGAAAGALAGGGGAAVYALHCPELAAPFLAVWYVAGIALVTAVGALAGARCLRW